MTKMIYEITPLEMANLRKFVRRIEVEFYRDKRQNRPTIVSDELMEFVKRIVE